MRCCHFHIFIFFFSAQFFFHLQFTYRSILVGVRSHVSWNMFFPLQKTPHHVPLENFGTISKKMKTHIFATINFEGLGYGCFQNRGTPKWMVYNENPSKMDDLGVPLFSETPIYVLVFRGGPSGHLDPGDGTPSCWDRGSFLMYIELGIPVSSTVFFGGEIFWGWTKMPGGDGFLRWCLICFFCFPIVR